MRALYTWFVIAVEVDAQDVARPTHQADHFAERHALPNLLASRAAQAATLHHLEELDAVLFSQFKQRGVVEGRAVLELERLFDLVADDLDLPGFRCEPGLFQFVPFKLGRQAACRARAIL